MTNEERRIELAKARRQAVLYAEASESPLKQRELALLESTCIERANMWARVANALKIGAPDGPDSVDGHPSGIHTEYGVITR